VKTNAIPKTNINRDVAAAAYRKRALSQEIVTKLRAAALATGVERVLRVAADIDDCGSKENIWLGRDLHNEDGELFETSGTLRTCNKRFCPYCAASLRRKSRKRARSGVKRVNENRAAVEKELRERMKEIANRSEDRKKKELEIRLAKKYLDLRWRSLTLTAPTVIGRTLVETIDIFNEAFELLMKRSFWISFVAGGIKGVEFTLGDKPLLWVVDKDGYHVHIHVLVFAEWLVWEKLREEWTYCITEAWARHGHELKINTPSGQTMVRISLVVARKKKGASNVMTEEEAIQEVIKYVTKSDSWLKVPDDHLVECVNVKKWNRMFELFGVAREKKVFAVKEEGGEGSSTILDNTNLKADEIGVEQEAETGNVKAEKSKFKIKSVPVLDWPEDMPHEEWLEKAQKKWDKDREFRKRMLADRYPAASFVLLNGERFGVVEAPD